MKQRLPSFLSGVVTTLVVLALSVSALAASGLMTIDVTPINVMVNGEVFQPKDANGKEVPVFAYNGTTYAPLRALATAYGLEVGYDPEKNLATVSQQGTAPVSTPQPAQSATGLLELDAKTDYSYSTVINGQNVEGILYEGKEYYKLTALTDIYSDTAVVIFSFNIETQEVSCHRNEGFPNNSQPLYTLSVNTPHFASYMGATYLERSFFENTILPLFV
jgi:Copper amine oxidase N-terminal domain.